MKLFVFALLTIFGAGVGLAVGMTTVNPRDYKASGKMTEKAVGGAVAGMAAAAVGIWLTKDKAKKD